MVNQQKKIGNATEVGSSILSKNNKNSFSQPNQNDAQRKSETNYQSFQNQNLKSSQIQNIQGMNKGSQQNMKSNGSEIMNQYDPLHHPNQARHGGNQNSYYVNG